MNPQSPFSPQQPVQQPQVPQQPAQFQQSNYIIPEKPSNGWKITAVVGITIAVLAIAGLAWAVPNYLDQKNFVDGKVSTAVAEAMKEQEQKDAAEYEAEKAKSTQVFSGPEDYGQVSFSYRKDWSVYVAKDASSGGSYEAYFHPAVVSAVNRDSVYALRLTIETTDYDKVVSSYQRLVADGSLKTSTVQTENYTGTRLEGNFTKDIRGSAVIFKIRDKTVTLRSDADTFKSDFDALIQTVTFNK